MVVSHHGGAGSSGRAAGLRNCGANSPDLLSRPLLLSVGALTFKGRSAKTGCQGEKSWQSNVLALRCLEEIFTTYTSNLKIAVTIPGGSLQCPKVYVHSLRTIGPQTTVGMTSKLPDLLRVPSAALFLSPWCVNMNCVVQIHMDVWAFTLWPCSLLAQQDTTGYPVASLLTHPLRVYLEVVFQLQSTWGWGGEWSAWPTCLPQWEPEPPV